MSNLSDQLTASLAVAEHAKQTGVPILDAFKQHNREKAIQDEAAAYVDLAESGERDWADFDQQASCDALYSVMRILEKAGDAREKCADARSVICLLISRNADLHARICLDNGTL